MRDVEPATCFWVGIIGAALGLDVYLIRNGHRSLSTVCGESRIGRVLVVYLAAHLLHVGPRRFDPLSAIARRLAR